MGKMLNVLVIIFAVELAMGLFFTGCVAGGDSDNCEQTSLFGFLLHPENWSFSALLGMVSENVWLLGGATSLVLAGTIWMKSDFLVYAGISGTLFGFGKTLFRLHQAILTTGFFGGDEVGGIIATILLGGLLIYCFVAALDFARGRD